MKLFSYHFASCHIRWAYGVLVFEMLSQRTPFEDAARKEETTMRNILKQHLEFPSTPEFNDTNRSFLSALLQKNPLDRMESEYHEKRLLLHPYFKNTDFVAIASRSAVAPWVPALAANTDSSHFDPG
jgi:serine/threonine protein kinase